MRCIASCHSLQEGNDQTKNRHYSSAVVGSLSGSLGAVAASAAVQVANADIMLLEIRRRSLQASCGREIYRMFD